MAPVSSLPRHKLSEERYKWNSSPAGKRPLLPPPRLPGKTIQSIGRKLKTFFSYHRKFITYDLERWLYIIKKLKCLKQTPSWSCGIESLKIHAVSRVYSTSNKNFILSKASFDVKVIVRCQKLSFDVKFIVRCQSHR